MSLQYPLDRRLGGPQTRSGRYEEGKRLDAVVERLTASAPGIESKFSDRASCRVVIVPNEPRWDLDKHETKLKSV
jgi:hypothetical protein